MPLRHDPEHTARHYDAYGDEEWQRHDRSPAARTSVAVHRAYLAEYMKTGDVVLDAGAGPGYYTISLCEQGAQVHVGDLSPVQLELNAERVAAAGHEASVVSRTVLDICDLSMFDDSMFDAVVCFGGPLSYVLDRAPDALAELCRVTRHGGHVLLSVMSTLGSLRRFISGVLVVGRQFGPQHNDDIVVTGDLPRATNEGHECHMYRWAELAALLEPYGTIVGASASNFITVQPDGVFEPFTAEEHDQLLRWELELCREPGALDGGTHIVAVLRVP